MTGQVHRACRRVTGTEARWLTAVEIFRDSVLVYCWALSGGTEPPGVITPESLSCYWQNFIYVAFLAIVHTARLL